MGSGWREIGGVRKYYRSTWEANFARFLELLKEKKWILEWVHEPKTFWFEGIKRGCVSYKPDFLIIEVDGSSVWIEVKGYWDAKSKTKVKRFRKYFPQEELQVIDGSFFKKNNGYLRKVIKDWENGNEIKIKKKTWFKI
jgi:Protein of unknown function (DUF1064)